MNFDRRTVLALVLVAVVILLTPRLFPPPQRSPLPGPDSAFVSDTQSPAQLPAQPPPAPIATAAPAVSAAPSSQTGVVPVIVPAETLSVSDSNATMRVVTTGGALLDADMHRFEALGGKSGSVRLSFPSVPLIRFQGVVGRDTIPFDTATFRVLERQSVGSGERIRLEGASGADTLVVTWHVRPDSFLTHLDAQVRGPLVASGGFILLRYSPSINSFEADTVDDHRNLGFAYQVAQRGAKGTGFGSLDPGERQIVQGPLTWVAMKNKYFIVGVLARDSVSPMVEFSMTGGLRTSRVATLALGTTVIQPRTGEFSLDVYAGPQQAARLSALGRDFENSNPYGGFMQPVVQPFAGLVLTVLLWLRHTFDISYGWVLVIFGVAVRLILWPLNQKAMRTSFKMQKIQPELSALQTKYKSDPQKLQSEMMRVYKEHNMSPFSMFSGCLPLLIPMPILFALFFVFQNTIEFRGVSFMWLADISQKDPYYILPLLMGASMFVLSWIGTRNTPPNPQTKMMGYVMPVMMTFLLANFAAGLNLYYAVQNLASLPQQWLIANERAKANASGKPARK